MYKYSSACPYFATKFQSRVRKRAWLRWQCFKVLSFTSV